ncbi:uncharacterized protein BX663DRAFT_500211 [Cokeromyces recurvatus]|uniref:uncharacterized protein n=1 Tax=Cokeromyces recurvatus TaxID=90255 RepID=UPI00222013E6|nr:uncharacterized protein BX663DRAFT_500211 [Cokeromyces recurvatus]KAI7905579.1 hypothetical protein BX663DRAFT_500211 [Cokeromyces recurvatus]
MQQNNLQTPPPPPTYQQSLKPGQTYYEPPPVNNNYAPPPPATAAAPPPSSQPQNMGQRFTQFYAPPQNRSLGLKRRLCSFILCCIIIGLTIGLATGLTRRTYYHNSHRGCNCRVNSDCTNVYGPGTYCYSNCQCARR